MWFIDVTMYDNINVLFQETNMIKTANINEDGFQLLSWFLKNIDVACETTISYHYWPCRWQKTKSKKNNKEFIFP